MLVKKDSLKYGVAVPLVINKFAVTNVVEVLCSVKYCEVPKTTKKMNQVRYTIT